MNAVSSIVKKELTRVFTDKKLIISLFIMPGVLIVVMYSLMGKMMSNMESDIEEHVPAIYVQNAPANLNQTIKAAKYKANITYLKDSDSIASVKDDILKGNADLLVVFDKGFSDTIQAYKAAGDAIPEVKTYYNTAEDYSQAARDSFVNSVLNTYKQALLSQRLGNMEQLQVFYIDKDPSSSIIVNKEKAGGKSLSMLLPFLINIMLFSGAMGLGVDAITGEKERGTLSSMLLSPIKRSKIVFGKLISLGILSSISAIIYAAAVIIGIQNLSSGAGETANLGSITVTPVKVIELLAMLLVIVYFYVAMVALVSVYARTVKEASTYNMPLMIIVMLGSIMTMFSTGGSKGLEYYAIPVYNSSVSMQNLLMGELTLPQFGLTIGTTALLAFLITVLVTRAFNSEKVMFNS